MKFLVTGLGNPGDEYVHTRHNMGFLAVDYVALQHKLSFCAERYALVGSTVVGDHELYLIKPVTYVNESGRAVRYWLQRLKIPIERSLVIVDDIALPFGVMRFRTRGTSGGHNGLKSLSTYLVSQDYPRLRVGIGSNFQRGSLSAFVLGKFTAQEMDMLDLQFHKVCALVADWMAKGSSYVMNRYN